MWPRNYRLIMLVSTEYSDPEREALDIIEAEPDGIEVLVQPSNPRMAAKHRVGKHKKLDDCIVGIRDLDCLQSLVSRFREDHMIRTKRIPTNL